MIPFIWSSRKTKQWLEISAAIFSGERSGWRLMGKGYKGTFWDDGTVLYLMWFHGVCVCKNSTSCIIKTHKHYYIIYSLRFKTLLSPYIPTQANAVLTLCRYCVFYQMNVCGNPALNDFIFSNSIFSLCDPVLHFGNSLNISTFSLL